MMFLANNGGSKTTEDNKSSSSNGSFFGWGKEKKDPYDQAKEWKRNLQKEIRRMDRDISNLKRAEQRSIKECQSLAKKNRVSAVKILAKEIVNTRKTMERMYMAKAQMGSVQSQLQTQMSMLKMQGVMAKSAEIMEAMNQLVNIKEMREVMGKMAREMEHAGLVDEIIGETLESLEPEGLNDEADKEADKIVAEITGQVLSPAATAPTEIKKTETTEPTKAEQNIDAKTEEETDKSTEELLSRLQAL